MTGPDHELPLVTCTCGHERTYHWAHRGACEACACLFFELRRKGVPR